MGHLPTLTLRYSLLEKSGGGGGRVFSYSCRCPQAPKGLPEPGIWSEALKSKPSPAWGQVSLQLTARLHKSRWEQLPPTEPFPSSFLFDPIPPDSPLSEGTALFRVAEAPRGEVSPCPAPQGAGSAATPGHLTAKVKAVLGPLPEIAPAGRINTAAGRGCPSAVLSWGRSTDSKCVLVPSHWTPRSPGNHSRKPASAVLPATHGRRAEGTFTLLLSRGERGVPVRRAQIREHCNSTALGLPS